MSLKLSITIKGDKEVQRKLKRLGDSLYNMTDAMVDIGNYATNYYRTTGFTDRGRPYGQEWRDYSQSYKIWKEKHWPGRPMLVQTGKMQDSFYAKAGAKQVVIGNRAKYFKYHQSAATRYVLPRRQMMGINNPIKRTVQKIVQKEVAKKLRTV